MISIFGFAAAYSCDGYGCADGYGVSDAYGLGVASGSGAGYMDYSR